MGLVLGLSVNNMTNNYLLNVLILSITIFASLLTLIIIIHKIRSSNHKNEELKMGDEPKKNVMNDIDTFSTGVDFAQNSDLFTNSVLSQIVDLQAQISSYKDLIDKNKKLETAFENTIIGWSHLVELRGARTDSHINRIV